VLNSRLGPSRNGYIAIVAAVSPSRDDRAAAPKGFTGIGNDYLPPESSELVIDTSTRPLTDATDEIERTLAATGILFDELTDLAANI
jgi:bifunctional enzyme CysN/CysC